MGIPLRVEPSTVVGDLSCPGDFGTLVVALLAKRRQQDDPVVFGESVGDASCNRAERETNFGERDHREFFSDFIENPPTPADALPEGASVGEVTLARLNGTPVGDQLVAYRLTLPISIETLTIDSFLDIVLVRKGRSIANVTFQSAVDPYPTDELDRIVALAAERLPS